MGLNPWKTNTNDRKLLENGVHALARIVDYHTTSASTGGGRTIICKVTLEFETQSGRVVRTTGKLPVNVWDLGKWSKGSTTVDIRYDPADPDKWTYSQADTDATNAQMANQQSLGFAGNPSNVISDVQVVNASGADPATVIAKLQRVRDQGLITDAQFQAAASQLGGTPAESAAGQLDVTPPGSAPTPASDVAERLQKLDDLHAQALISEPEYAAERQRILDSI